MIAIDPLNVKENTPPNGCYGDLQGIKGNEGGGTGLKGLPGFEGPPGPKGFPGQPGTTFTHVQCLIDSISNK